MSHKQAELIKLYCYFVHYLEWTLFLMHLINYYSVCRYLHEVPNKDVQCHFILYAIYSLFTALCILDLGVESIDLIIDFIEFADAYVNSAEILLSLLFAFSHHAF